MPGTLPAETMRSRPPGPLLRPFVKVLWAMGGASAGAGTAAPGPTREVVLPTGDMHVVIRLSDHPLRLFGSVDDPRGTEVGLALVGGARAEAYVRDVSRPSRSVGAQLHPGAGELLFGVPADALSGRHSRLEELWGRFAAEARERLLALDAADLEGQLRLFESLLATRVRPDLEPQRLVTHALARFARGATVRQVVEESGYSHRHFDALFRAAVGLNPKRYLRVRRFQRALNDLTHAPRESGRGRGLAALALECGYSDQAHFNREFAELTGVTPSEYRARTPRFPNHLPAPASRS